MRRAQQSAALRHEIEAKLAPRMLGVLSPQYGHEVRLRSTGVAKIDGLLGGGLPIGGISELTGTAGSGLTSVALALLAGVSPEQACAYVDVSDTLDPRSAAAAGVCLGNLLWVRFAAAPSAAECVKVGTNSTADGVDLPGRQSKLVGHSCGWHHPRMETNGMGHAMEQMFKHKAESRMEKREGTPGFPNHKLTLEAASQEQVQYEQFNTRGADVRDPIWQADQRSAEKARIRARTPLLVDGVGSDSQKPEKRWTKLDKAIRATDHILQSGGFGVVILDLSDIAADAALRIPAATWFRFRRAALESDAIFLLLSQVGCARSSALCVLECGSGRVTGKGLLNEFSRTVGIARQRLGYGKKAPGRVTSWEAAPQWMLVKEK